MPIRHEDKEFIQALSLFGAVFGACLGIFLVTYLSDNAREDYTQQTEYVQNRTALIKLQSTVVNPNNPIADENVLNQLQQHIDQTPAPVAAVQKNFWLRMPRWCYLGLCGGGLAVGAVTGYSAVWLVGWIGSVIVMCCIRILYGMIRKTAPNSAAAKRSIIPSQIQSDPAGSYHREEGRILPVVVKLVFLMVLLLTLLAVVMWRLTGI